MKCPMCRRNEVTKVGPWPCMGAFGLGFNMKDGKTCCSIPLNNLFATEEEAQQHADSQSLEHWAMDYDTSWQDDQEDIIGDLYDDPYDHEPMSF